jgi:acyl-CoA dehydrogenase
MRGTCSPPATVEGSVAAWQVLPTPFRILAATSMVPVSHILWAAVWLGIANDAFDRARRCLQQRVRKDPDGSPATALRLADLATEIDLMRAQIDAALCRHALVMAADDPEKEIDLAGTLADNELKLSSSERVVRVVQEAFQVCGIAAYRNDGEFSLGRHLRDAQSAPLMIHNDRIRSTNADLLLVYKGR